MCFWTKRDRVSGLHVILCEKVQAIAEFHRPSDTRAVKSFLGTVNFYRRHVKDLASIARPLMALTRKDKATDKMVRFVGDSECEEAFEKLKILLVTAPVLRPPDLVTGILPVDRHKFQGFWGSARTARR